MAPTPQWTGRNSKVRFTYDGDSVVVDALSWTVKPVYDEIAEGYDGEDRDRLQKEIKYYEMSLQTKTNDMKVVTDVLLPDQDNEDAGVLPKDKAVGLLIYPRDGSKVAFVGSEVTIGAWELASPARTQTNNLPIPLRMRYFKQAS